jgi:hypothetical protein
MASRKKRPTEPLEEKIFRQVPEERQVNLFLKSLATTGRVGESIQAAGLNRSTVFALKRSDHVFAEQWQEAMDTYCDMLEAEIERRAVAGWDEPVFHMGEVCGYKRKFSDTLLLAKAKRHIPEYRDTQTKIDVGSGGVIVTVAPPTGTDAQAIEDEWRRKFRAQGEAAGPVTLPEAPRA